MRIVQIRKPQPPVEASTFRETFNFIVAAGLFVFCYILLAGAF